MPFTMSQASVAMCETGLNALVAVLDKAVAHAEAKKVDPSVLLGWRLAPDMYPLTRQIQIITDQAKNGLSRLANVEPPRYEDNETTVEALRERLLKTLAYIKTLDRAAIDASAERTITFPLGPKKAEMIGAAYLNHFVLPNFYFHLTAAYAIARNFGADIGKRDFIGAIPLTMA